jgi:alpha-D-xyloside xylohydrolase
MPGEVTFQNDPVDPAAEFGKQQNHFFVAERAERLDPGRAAGDLIWKRMSLAQRVSYRMLGTLRGGLSLGLCGFTFWTHFVGDFPKPPDADLYLRWRAFGVLSSHTRCHGAPRASPGSSAPSSSAASGASPSCATGSSPTSSSRPRPPASAATRCCGRSSSSSPTTPARGSWRTRYLLGSDLLVAPLFEDAGERATYLPPGRWHRFDSAGDSLEGPGWRTLAVEEIPAIVLVRDGAALRLAEPAQHTGELDWDRTAVWRPGG